MVALRGGPSLASSIDPRTCGPRTYANTNPARAAPTARTHVPGLSPKPVQHYWKPATGTTHSQFTHHAPASHSHPYGCAPLAASYTARQEPCVLRSCLCSSLLPTCPTVHCCPGSCQSHVVPSVLASLPPPSRDRQGPLADRSWPVLGHLRGVGPGQQVPCGR